jgi:hypothetical protein
MVPKEGSSMTYIKRTDEERRLDWADRVTCKCDNVMLALDILGWCVRIKNPKTPEEATRKWLLNYDWDLPTGLNIPRDFCPDWCEPHDAWKKT